MQVMDKPHGVTKKINLGVLLAIGTQAGQILEHVGNAHSLAVLYKGLRALLFF